MITLNIEREKLGNQLLPFTYKGTIVFSLEYEELYGMFGIKDNTVIFISSENLENTLEITIPESLTEIQSQLVLAEYALERILTTPNFNMVIEGREVIDRKEAVNLFYTFIRSYKKNVKEMEFNQYDAS